MSGNKKMGLIDGDGVKAIIESYVMNGEQDSLEMLQNIDSDILTAKQWKNAFKKFKYEDDEEINYRLTDALFVVVDNSTEKPENFWSPKFQATIVKLSPVCLNNCEINWAKLLWSCSAKKPTAHFQLS